MKSEAQTIRDAFGVPTNDELVAARRSHARKVAELVRASQFCRMHFDDGVSLESIALNFNGYDLPTRLRAALAALDGE